MRSIAERAHVAFQLVRGHGGEARVQGHFDGRSLDGVRTPVTGSNPDGLVYGKDENLAVADAPGSRRILDRYLLTPEQWAEQEAKRKPSPPVATPTNTE